MQVTQKTLMCLWVLASFAGCTVQSDEQEYLDRLSRVLEVSRPALEVAHTDFPRLRDLDYKQKTNSISIKSFLGLRECRLHIVLAERNSQLGRVAGASQRLFNDLKILDSGPDCLATIENGELKAKLSTYLEEKRQSIPQILAHALLAQPEYKTLWQAKAELKNYPNFLPSNSIINDLIILDRFAAKILDDHYQFTKAETSNIELALGRLRFGDAGHLLRELEKLTAILNAANTMIGERLTKKLCANTNPTPNSKYFQNVVGLYFIEKLQPRLVLLTQRFRQLMPTIEQFENRLSVYADDTLLAWIEQRNQALETALSAPRQHAIQIQALFNQCGISSGNKLP